MRFIFKWRKQREEDLNEEIKSHLTMATQDSIDRGYSPEDAKFAAHKELGNIGLIKETTRDMWGYGMLDVLWTDLKYAVRLMMRNPGFTLTVVLTLALGIGMNTALFSVIDAMLLKTLPVKDPEQLVIFKTSTLPKVYVGSTSGYNDFDPETGFNVTTSFPYKSFMQLRERQDVLSDLIAFSDVRMNVNIGGQSEIVRGQVVSGNYYAGLGVNAILGRIISIKDDSTKRIPVAVLSYRFWQNNLGGNVNAIGKQININNTAFTVIGVTPPNFVGVMQVGEILDVTIPIAWEPKLYVDPKDSRLYGPGERFLRLMGRLKSGVTIEQARNQLESTYQQSFLDYRSGLQELATADGEGKLTDLDSKDYPRLGVESGALGEMDERQRYAPSLYLLLGMVGLVILIACANIANLLLSRASARRKEIGVRLALGAGRVRLVRQLLTESVLLASLGGLLGIIIAWVFKEKLLAVSDWTGQTMIGLQPQLNWRVLVFTLVLSILTGILFGIVPALQATKPNLLPELNASGRNSRAFSQSYLTRGLIVIQVALALLLLIGAGLFTRTLINLQTIDVGFNTQNLLLFNIRPILIGYEGDKLTTLYQQISKRLESIPGVRGVTFSENRLLSGNRTGWSIYLRSDLDSTPGLNGRYESRGAPLINCVRENFTDVMEIPMIAGRSLNKRDNAVAPKVVIINRAFATEFFPNENPIGKHFTFDTSKPDEVEIVGMTKDSKYDRQRRDIRPIAYLPWQQWIDQMKRETSFEVRTNVDPYTIVSSIRQAVREVDPALPLVDIRTQIEQANQILTMELLFAKLTTLFGLLAQQLAAIGIFSVLAYSIYQRAREIGIRMALGANRSNILKMILRQGMLLTCVGIGIGVVSTFALIKVLGKFMNLSTLLYGVETFDPLTYGGAILLVLFVTFFACYLPAKKATKVDPMIVLKCE